MKKLITSLILLCSIAVQGAAVYQPVTVFSWLGQVGITNGGSNAYVPGAAWGIPATQTTNGLIDCRKQQNVAIQYSFNFNTNKVGTNWVAWVGSVDGVNWDYTNSIVKHHLKHGAAAAGANTVQITNIDTTGYGYYKMYWWSNDIIGWGGGGVVQTTNIVVKYGVKIP